MSSESLTPPDVVALAVDGMEPSLLDRWIEAGELPNFARLREDGAFGTADCSTTSSATQWTTHFTGVGPTEHGVDGFLTTDRTRKAGDRAPESRDLINLSNIHVKTYPELLSAGDIRVGLINPLPLWPPLELTDGFCISGMLTPPSTDRWFSPPSLETDLAETGYRIDVRYDDRPYGFVDDDLFGEVSLAQLREDMFAVLDARIAFTKRAVTEYDLDYLYVLLKSIDIIQHCFWTHMEHEDETYGDTILEAYRRVDDLIGWLDGETDEHILVFSDHGFKRRRSNPPPTLNQIALTVANTVPVPSLLKNLYFKVTTSPVDTEEDTEITSTTGVHAKPAAWILAGPDVEPTADHTIDFEDITPTILALLEQPIPTAYIGAPISPLQVEIRTKSISLSAHRDLDITENEVVSERLHNLGYAEMVDDN